MIEVVTAVLIFGAGFGAGVYFMAQRQLMNLRPRDPGPPPEYNP